MEHRELAALVVAGAALPVATIGAVGWATAAFGLHWAVPFFLLLASPLLAAAGVYATGVRTGSLRAPRWLPVGGGRRTVGDQLPNRYHEEFAPETLEETATDEPDLPARLLAMVLVYLLSIPVYTVVLWGPFG